MAALHRNAATHPYGRFVVPGCFECHAMNTSPGQIRLAMTEDLLATRENDKRDAYRAICETPVFML